MESASRKGWHGSVRRFLKDGSGAVAIEYGLICSLIFLVIVGAMHNVADALMVGFWNPTAAAFGTP